MEKSSTGERNILAIVLHKFLGPRSKNRPATAVKVSLTFYLASEPTVVWLGRKFLRPEPVRLAPRPLRGQSMTPSSSDDVILILKDDTHERLRNHQFISEVTESGEQVSIAGVTLAVFLRSRWWEYVGTQDGDRCYRER